MRMILTEEDAKKLGKRPGMIMNCYPPPEFFENNRGMGPDESTHLGGAIAKILREEEETGYQMVRCPGYRTPIFTDG